jgi:drug/metabolite transporter (DMT)-like permease
MTLNESKTNSHPSSHAVKGFLFLLVSVLFWGSSAPLAKHLIVTRFDTLIMAQTRTTLTFILLAVFFFIQKREIFRIELRDLWKFCVMGVVGIAATNYSYYFTAKESSVATAILIQYTAPVWVVLFAVFISKEEKFDLLTLLSLVLALAGCCLAVTGGSLQTISLRGWAAITGPMSALTYAYQILATKQLLKKYSIWTFLVYAFGFSAIFWFIINPPWRILTQHYSASDWGILWLFAIVSILIPQTAFASGLKLLKASTAGIIGTLEPIIAIVVAYFLLGELLTTIQLLGAVIVVVAVGLLQVHPLIMQKAMKVE